MSKAYTFFQHKTCEFFPCHEVEDVSTYNCLFCYCPLYALGEHCGGQFKYTGTVKDCSDCTLPHTPGAYDRIMAKMGDVIDLVRRDPEEKKEDQHVG